MPFCACRMTSVGPLLDIPAPTDNTGTTGCFRIRHHRGASMIARGKLLEMPALLRFRVGFHFSLQKWGIAQVGAVFYVVLIPKVIVWATHLQAEDNTLLPITARASGSLRHKYGTSFSGPPKPQPPADGKAGRFSIIC